MWCEEGGGNRGQNFYSIHFHPDKYRIIARFRFELISLFFSYRHPFVLSRFHFWWKVVMQMKSVPFLPVARTFRGRIKPDAFFANFMQIIASNKNLEKPLCCYISIYLLSSSWYCSFSINYNIISRINDAIHVLRLTLINSRVNRLYLYNNIFNKIFNKISTTV